MMLHRTNLKMTPATVDYIERLVDTFTMGEAKAVLTALGKHQLTEIWYVRKDKDNDAVGRVCRDGDGIYWESQCFNKVPVSQTCVLKYIKLAIRFYGGPPQKLSYQKGTLRTFVCDRLLTACALRGKCHTSQRIYKALAKARAQCVN
jgi:hypothetical protein